MITIITHTHLTAGLKPNLDPVLYQLFIKHLGQPLYINTRHAVWEKPAHSELIEWATIAQHDVAHLSPYLSWANFSVLAMDMDSTLINIECIDEMADFYGKKSEVARITEATMRGEIADFNDSLRKRVGLLKGLPIAALQTVLDTRLQLNPGAELLVESAHKQGIQTLLVSGGFTFFTDAMQTRLRLNYTRSNVLNHNGYVLDGTLQEPIINAQAKCDTVYALCKQLGVNTNHAIVMGDGSNDLAMMAIAGLSIAYHAKPAVQEKAMVAINYGGLDTVTLWLNYSMLV